MAVTRKRQIDRVTDVSGSTYEGDVVKRFMNLVALQPLVVDEAFMPHMKAMDVPFQTMYGSLICFKGLQSDRPKC